MEEMYFKWNGSILKGSMEPGEPGRLDLYIPFSMKDEIKLSVKNARWNPSKKCWTADDCFRTRMVLKFLQGHDIYKLYDAPLVEFTPNRPTLYEHQKLMVRHILTRHFCVIAAEMGTGKTLAAIEAMENSGVTRWWYVAPKSALESVKYQLTSWRAKVVPHLMTYEQMVRTLAGWDRNMAPPQGVFFDESSRIKTATAQRTQAAMYLADNIREYYGDNGFVVLMSGSPAPKSPVDWWSQCEAAFPGFLREGSPEKFRDRIALMRMEENMSGIKYPKLITYRDSEKKCAVCGKFEESELHKQDVFSELTHVPAGQSPDQVVHKFVPMRDEISIMHKRMNGLVLVQFKKDCLDLPEKVYQTVELKPTKHMMRLAKMIQKSAPSMAQALILLRELSDGFQYHERLVGKETCTYCNGTKRYKDADCIHCSGEGFKKVYQTETVECETPKVEYLKDLLDQKEEDGRLIVFAGFTGSIDKVCATVLGNKGKKWNYIRVDGRGWHSDLGISDPQRLIEIFQEKRNDYPNVCFVGHPGSAGMGLTLTASDTTLYFSNDFNAESRIQSEDRTHRPGSRGCNIIDLVHLPVDKLVIENLRSKRDLMKITMGDLQKAIDSEEGV